MKAFITRLCAAVLLLGLPGLSNVASAQPSTLTNSNATAQAQTPAPAPDTARFYRHHLGLTASPQLDQFFKVNRSLPLGLIYKRQTKPGQALRLRLVGFYGRRDTVVTIPPTTSTGPDTRSWAVNAFFGYEWQHALSRCFKWGYGMEAGAGYDRQDLRYALQVINQSPQGPFVTTRTGSEYVRRWLVQGRPFASISYALGARLTVFAESSLPIVYASQERSGEWVERFSNGVSWRSSGPGSTKNSYFTFHFKPVQLVGITASL
ncbi:hypothetical protein [Hymenobacter glacialis]|uniref:Uncharacterized protein n=1 Tax=Hymenobacter glacialis TaxID=1908236 RepID=A0A1G1T5A2_9BACT|nr:hypothetical protein [Hymenobacter glacialis]OGX86059.1 hypothetical protein BEN48_13500 [Hymenobacter glacialis]